MNDYTKLIERLRKAARYDSVFGDDVREHASEQAADAIEALQAENERLKERTQILLDDCNTWAQELKNERRLSFRAERDALQAKLDAMDKREPVAHVYAIERTGRPLVTWDDTKGIVLGDKLYAAPKALAPLTDEQIEPLVDIAYKHWQDKTTFDIAAVRADFRANGIGGTP